MYINVLTGVTYLGNSTHKYISFCIGFWLTFIIGAEMQTYVYESVRRRKWKSHSVHTEYLLLMDTAH